MSASALAGSTPAASSSSAGVAAAAAGTCERSCRWRCRLRGVAITALTLALSSQVLPVQAVEEGLLDPTIQEDNFCLTPETPGHEQPLHEISTSSMNCAKLMEFVFASRIKVLEGLQRLSQAANSSYETSALGDAPLWVKDFETASKASSLLSANAHVVAAIASQRSECFSEYIRLLSTAGLKRQKAMVVGHLQMLWKAVQLTPAVAGQELHNDLIGWVDKASSQMEGDLRTMQTVLKTWRPPSKEESSFYTQEADGRYSTMELLRRFTFEEHLTDKGLLRGLLRHVFSVDATVGDFGAGTGQYSTWLNDTGLATAFAYDGSQDVEVATKGLVMDADLGTPLNLNRKFDWVMCIEVAEHIPQEMTAVFLQNLEEHANVGVILSWARPGLQSMGFANPRSEQDVLGLVGQHTKLYINVELTTRLRAASTVPRIGESLLVLVRDPNMPGVASAGGGGDVGKEIDGGCQAEDGWIYAGNDVQMFSNVPTASDCCKLCSQNELCSYWTWSREDAHKDLCWIKSTREYRINHDGFVSGGRAPAA